MAAVGALALRYPALIDPQYQIGLHLLLHLTMLFMMVIMLLVSVLTGHRVCVQGRGPDGCHPRGVCRQGWLCMSHGVRKEVLD